MTGTRPTEHSRTGIRLVRRQAIRKCLGAERSTTQPPLRPGRYDAHRVQPNGRAISDFGSCGRSKSKTRGPVGSAGSVASRNWHAFFASDLNSRRLRPPSQIVGEGVPEAGFEPARRCRRHLAKKARLPVPPFGHVHENGAAEKRSPQDSSRSLDPMVASRARTNVTDRLPYVADQRRPRESTTILL